MSRYFKGVFGPLLIAEIGGNHEGDFTYAKKLCELAIDTKADCVKFQVYTGDGLVSPVESPDRNQHFKKFELSSHQHIELAKKVKQSGKKYTASVWEKNALEWIDPYIDFYKIGSGDLTAYALLEAIAKKRKPIVLSTGLSTEIEVMETVAFLQMQDDMYKSEDNLALLQCTSMYPIQYGDANLNVMKKYKEETGLTVGYSDHTIDLKALQYAAAMGAQILEFHFTDTKEGKTFRDHKVSLTKNEVEDLAAELAIIRTLKGSAQKQPISIEIENGHVNSFRRAVYLNKDVAAGYAIKEEDLVLLRPNYGIDARHYKTIVGKKLKKPIKAFEKIEIKNLQ
ncbi:MAG: N-acetylneuraminate synthase family protein [Chitinophagaceae bacterium]